MASLGLAGSPTSTASSRVLRAVHARMKRLMDLVIAAAGLVIAVPGMLVLGALIKLMSKGPIFHVHERVGQNGKLFKVHALRSAGADTEAVRPGIIGLAQVRHHSDRTIEDVQTKLAYDLEYITRASLLLDLHILASTLANVIRGRGGDR